MFFLPAETVIAHSLGPTADAGGRTGVYVSLKNAVMAWIVYYIYQGNAATIALAPNQAVDVSGTSAKAIPVVPIWSNADLVTSSALARVAADAVSFTTSAAVKYKLVIFQIDPAKLDGANGFCTVCAVTGASNAANITSAFVVLAPRYPQLAGVNAMAN